MSEMRLQRALARAGVASRRAAEKLIEDGRVRVDGKPATLGMKVDPARQKITVGNRAVKLRERRWLAFHKPLGVVTTAKDEEGRRTVLDFIPDATALTYVGRLDVMTTGLLLLTTDGEAVHRLTHPRYHIPRRYTALVHGRPTAEIARAVVNRPALLLCLELPSLHVQPPSGDYHALSFHMGPERGWAASRPIRTPAARPS